MPYRFLNGQLIRHCWAISQHGLQPMAKLIMRRVFRKEGSEDSPQGCEVARIWTKTEGQKDKQSMDRGHWTV